ncbi:MAG: acetyl-CoA carboxylase biotin carboxyl carrier protein [Nitrospirota bacterium]
MNLKEIRELIEVLKETDVTELELEKAGTRIKIKKGAIRGQAPLPAAPTTAEGAKLEAAVLGAEEAEAPLKNIVVITSPIVGTFYRAPSPEAPVYVEVGDVVKKGQILCIIEAMKLMNEIEAEISGKVVAVLAENAQPVEYAEPLFHIEPI